MRTAVITGASSGLGRELFRQAVRTFPEIEEFWLISRSADKLRSAAGDFPEKSFRILALDLGVSDSYTEYENELREHQPEIALLINNAGCGYLGDVGNTSLSDQMSAVNLNVAGLTAVTHLSIPYMLYGGRIINVSSIASFCPTPRMTVYSATKSYISFFSSGIGEELRGRGISVTAVCPGPMETPFLERGHIRGNSKAFKTLPYSDPAKVAKTALAAAKKRRQVFTPRLIYKVYRVLAKILPQRLVIKFTKT
jgi:short-subunit dehydrogenase